MSSSYEEVVRAALSLTDDERRDLLDELFDSLPEHQCPPGILSTDDPGFLEELDRRMNDGSEWIPWSKVREELRKELLDEGSAG